MKLISNLKYWWSSRQAKKLRQKTDKLLDQYQEVTWLLDTLEALHRCPTAGAPRQSGITIKVNNAPPKLINQAKIEATRRQGKIVLKLSEHLWINQLEARDFADQMIINRPADMESMEYINGKLSLRRPSTKVEDHVDPERNVPEQSEVCSSENRPS